jgi:hypothetical protein
MLCADPTDVIASRLQEKNFSSSLIDDILSIFNNYLPYGKLEVNNASLSINFLEYFENLSVSFNFFYCGEIFPSFKVHNFNIYF